MTDHRGVPKRSLPAGLSTPRGVDLRHTPGLAEWTMRELAPFVAEEGVDLTTSGLVAEHIR
jgi:hypothetical protein